MTARDGAALYSLLSSINHPAAAALSPESLDWVTEQPGTDPVTVSILVSVSQEQSMNHAF